MTTLAQLPGLDCGLCGFRKCADLALRLTADPKLVERCIHLDKGATANFGGAAVTVAERLAREGGASHTRGCATAETATHAGGDAQCAILGKIAAAGAKRVPLPVMEHATNDGQLSWRDSLDREFDFYLEHFPEEPGPRETIIPHNPMITREMDIQAGDLLIGRPLGMSCGCPITHCGVVMDVDHRTGVINWCVTGPLKVREHGFKDLGYYIAEAYDGLIRTARCEIKIGMRYYFQPRMCMLQWRHSGLVNYLNRTKDGLQVRVEGLWIG